MVKTSLFFIYNIQYNTTQHNTTQYNTIQYAFTLWFNLFVPLSLHHSCILPKLEMCFSDDDVAQCFVSYAPDFEMYLQFITGLPQAEACISDKNTQHFFKARGYMVFSLAESAPSFKWCEVNKQQFFFYCVPAICKHRVGTFGYPGL